MDDPTTERSFDLQATWVIDMLGLAFDMLSMGVCATKSDTICKIKRFPISYTDDLSAVREERTTLQVVYNYSCRWRYECI